MQSVLGVRTMVKRTLPNKAQLCALAGVLMGPVPAMRSVAYTRLPGGNACGLDYREEGRRHRITYSITLSGSPTLRHIIYVPQPNGAEKLVLDELIEIPVKKIKEMLT